MNRDVIQFCVCKILKHVKINFHGKMEFSISFPGRIKRRCLLNSMRLGTVRAPWQFTYFSPVRQLAAFLRNYSEAQLLSRSFGLQNCDLHGFCVNRFYWLCIEPLQSNFLHFGLKNYLIPLLYHEVCGFQYQAAA